MSILSPTALIAEIEDTPDPDAAAVAIWAESVRRLRDENQRLRDLYENVVGNRERFGWTINHLLECDASLHEAEGRACPFSCGACSSAREQVSA
jgi:hypothetical protein